MANELIRTNSELEIMDGYKKLAAELIKSSLIPKSFKVMQDAWYALLYGRELGLSPIYSLNNVTVINGKPSLSADAMLAIVKRSPEYGGIEIDSSDTACTVKLKRIYGNGVVDITTDTFTIEDAKKAGLYNSPGQMYQKYPKRMLRARAVSFACRDGFGDIFAGSYTPEELNGGDEPDTPHKQEIVDAKVVEPKHEAPKSTPSELDNALKTANRLMGEFSMLYSVKEGYDQNLKAAFQAGDIGTMESLIAELEAKKQKAEDAMKAQRKPKVEEPITDAEIVSEEPAPEVDEQALALNKVRADIVNGFNALAKLKVDRFDQPSRKAESMKKHLDVENLAECTDIPKLEAYLEHLRQVFLDKDKPKEAKKEKGEKGKEEEDEKPDPKAEARKIIDALPEGYAKTQAEKCWKELLVQGSGWEFIIETDWSSMKEADNEAETL